jgi:hypothetical protein
VLDTNARDYPVAMIDCLTAALEKVAAKLVEWNAHVATINGQIVGTGSLNGLVVSSVFILRIIRGAASGQNSRT